MEKNWLPSKRNIFSTLAVIGILSVPLYYVHMKNEIVEKDERVRYSWSQVESTIQRRYELIPNLISSTKAYMAHESSVMEKLAKSRSEWINARTESDKVEYSNNVESALLQYNLTAEKYPELKASANFSELNTALEGSENRVAIERRRYIESVRDYNSYVKKFPVSLLNHPPRKAYYQIAAEAK